MRRRTWLLGVLLLLSGCGLGSATPAKKAPPPAPSKTSQSLPPSGSSASSGPVLIPAQETAAAKPLPPVRVLGLKKGSFKAPLQGSGSEDTLGVNVTSGSDGTLVIKNAQGMVLQTLAHVGKVGVLEFGKAHLPVIVTESSPTMCGSGGCSYASYTWSASASTFVPVPPPATVGFTYLPSKGAFQPGPLPDAQQLGSFFGFASLSSKGLAFVSRLYDLWQHGETTHYVYSATPEPYGMWVQQGPPTFSPQGAEPSVQFTDPGQAVMALMEARALNLPKQGMSLLPKGTEGKKLWLTLSPLTALGPSLSWGSQDPKVSPQGKQHQVTATLYGTSGEGAGMTLVVYNMTATVTGATNTVTAVSLAPLHQAFSTAPDVLKAVLGDKTAQKQLATKKAMVSLNVRGPSTWELEWVAPQNMSPWITVNAKTGAVATAPKGL